MNHFVKQGVLLGGSALVLVDVNALAAIGEFVIPHASATAGIGEEGNVHNLVLEVLFIPDAEEFAKGFHRVLVSLFA